MKTWNIEAKELTQQQMRNLYGVLDYMERTEANHFEEFMRNEFGDEANEILEGDWQETICAKPEILKVANQHIYLGVWKLRQEVFGE